MLALVLFLLFSMAASENEVFQDFGHRTNQNIFFAATRAMLIHRPLLSASLLGYLVTNWPFWIKLPLSFLCSVECFAFGLFCFHQWLHYCCNKGYWRTTKILLFFQMLLFLLLFFHIVNIESTWFDHWGISEQGSFTRCNGILLAYLFCLFPHVQLKFFFCGDLSA